MIFASRAALSVGQGSQPADGDGAIGDLRLGWLIAGVRTASAAISLRKDARTIEQPRRRNLDFADGHFNEGECRFAASTSRCLPAKVVASDPKSEFQNPRFAVAFDFPAISIDWLRERDDRSLTDPPAS